MELDWSQEAAGPVTLVHVRLRNERATDRRVSLRNRLDGPILPPRRRGVPEAGWDREGARKVVPAGGNVALGYACPAAPAEPPVVVDEVTAAEAPSEENTPDSAIRELGDHRPPRAVLGVERSRATVDDGSVDAQNDPDAGQLSQRPDGDRAPLGAGDSPPADSLPDDVAARLERLRTRIRTAEALSAAGVVEATALLEASGGLRGVESLSAGLEEDARELYALARTAKTLGDRAAAAAPPIEALRRLS